ncbi:L-aminopeptidase DmpA. Serine peptidase. MEROPS family S58 [Salinimicrobium sediminis]|uniref:L-aminopeptidase DmpA. Serine peptidase. MEROPS family S58 n=1 Tax=Salinimicrobium sediminis TaxID=1343891 RepID=A0A285X7S8_9FLAO|nr:P1 family peptidase [Salinimicrobium sediminis]SOC81382.1 L-aminopeptidase DmpA. Serine peptidase. MEROPS family S58 [Salinimicrobium sediminis]
MKKVIFTGLLFLVTTLLVGAQQRPRELGIEIGVMPTGELNAITDVTGVKVGHTTLIKGDSVRTGVTAILAHGGNIFQQKVPAAVFVGNGFGKLAGSTQITELGNLETPVILTNTLSVPTAMNTVIGYTLNLEGNEQVRSVNAVVGETNDGYLNDIRGRHLTEEDVLMAIKTASETNTEEGNIGAGTGTVAFGYKGGIGTSSRKLPESLGGYTVGVLVQSNYGGVLQINGVQVGEELKNFAFDNQLLNNVDGSCMIIVATDAPLDSRNLERLAKRAFLGLAKTGGIVSNGSGDYIIAFSTAEGVRIPYQIQTPTLKQEIVHNDRMTPLFMAAIEATEEAIINSLFMAETMTANGRTIEQLPVEEILPLFKNRR